MRKKVLYANANDPVGKVRVYECLCGLSIQRREALEAVARAAKSFWNEHDGSFDAAFYEISTLKKALAELERGDK